MADTKSIGSTRDKPVLHERAYAFLSDALMQGRLAPGQKLTLRQLADQLGMSMSPVREAVGRLAALKAVQVYPKRYILVCPITAELYMEMVEFRKLLEGHAAARACTRLSNDEISSIEHTNEVLLQHAYAGRMDHCMQENHHFHFGVYRRCGSSVLMEAIEQIWIRIGPSLNKLLAVEFARDESTLAEGFSHHRELIAALRNRDINGALSAITGDISTSTDYLLDGLRRQTDSPARTVGHLVSTVT